MGKKSKTRQHKRADILARNEEPIDYTTMQYLSNVMSNAETLFKELTKTGFKCVPPSNWIMNQDTMRTFYEEHLFEKKFDETNVPEYFILYMNFMYNHIPPGFGNAIISARDSNTTFNSVKSFKKLGGRVLEM